MASLTSKVVSGKTYYYARECKRVNGKPKIVRTTYLGSLEKIMSAVEGAKEPMQHEAVDIAAFGDIAALYDVANKCGLVDIIDKHMPKQRRQGLSTGQYILLAAINRAAHPTSKTKLAEWYRTTALPRLIPASTAQLSSQSFWNHMNLIKEEHIEAIERELSQRLVQEFGLSLRTLTYDGTNFFTYINTKTASALPQRGHNKQKRNDLRQVNLGMLVSTDFHVPLFHKIYDGNIHDSTVFKSVSQELRQRYVELAGGCQHITLIFDKGNNSKEALSELHESAFHFVGSLTHSQQKDLLKIPLGKYAALSGERYQDCMAYRTQRNIFGHQRTLVITFNENLLQGQLQGISHNLEKTRDTLHQIQLKLRRRKAGKVKAGKAPTYSSIKKQVEAALSKQFMKKLITYQLTDTAIPSLTYQTNTNELARLAKTELGKTILFTDNDEWSNEQIISAYRSQHQIESAFRQMKHPHFLRWMPMYHWTDNKIRVHAFYCVLALTLTSLLHRTVHKNGFDISIPRMMELLGGIRETLVIYPRKQGQRKHPTKTSLSLLSEEQHQLLKSLDLKRYL